MAAVLQHDPKLAQALILDELFDLSLYKALREITDRGSQKVLDELVRVEAEHLAFWQRFFDTRLTALDFGRGLKLWIFVLVCRVFGSTAVHLVLEAIEVHGVRKNLSLWKVYKDRPLGAALKGILLDEVKRGDVLVGQRTERKMNTAQELNLV